jgi:hypothetical protein
MAAATLASSQTLTEERSIIWIPGRASTNSGKVDPHLLLQPVSLPRPQRGRTILQQDQTVSAGRDALRQTRGQLPCLHPVRVDEAMAPRLMSPRPSVFRATWRDNDPNDIGGSQETRLGSRNAEKEEHIDLAELTPAADNDRRHGRADEHADNGRGNVARSEIVDTPALRPAKRFFG